MSSPKTMNAISVASFGEPEVLRLKSIPIPTLKPDQVLIRVHAAGVNPVETYMRAGNYARLPSLPWIPGNDGAGVVVAIYNSSEKMSSTSSSATTPAPTTPTTPTASLPSLLPHPQQSSAAHINVGARVWLSGSVTGTYAQYCVCTTAQVHPLPDNVDLAQGAAIGVAYRTAYRALHIRAKVKAGQSVLIHGASGGVGIAAVQLAVAHGCIVYGTAGTEEGMKLIVEHGCSYAFNHRQKGYMNQIYATTGDQQGIQVVLEMLANVNLNEDLKILAKGGTIAIIGNRGEININPRLLMLKESSIIGVLGGTQEEHEQCFAGINAGLASGAIKPVVATPAFMLEHASAAHHCVMDEGQGSAGKVVLITK
jgi:NADPH:quinone reductase